MQGEKQKLGFRRSLSKGRGIVVRLTRKDEGIFFWGVNTTMLIKRPTGEVMKGAKREGKREENESPSIDQLDPKKGQAEDHAAKTGGYEIVRTKSRFERSALLPGYLDSL